MEDNDMNVGAIGSTSTYSFIDRMVWNASRSLNSMRKTSKTQDATTDLSSVLASSDAKSGAQQVGAGGSSMRPTGPPPPPPDPSQMASRIIKAEDTNGDGALSAGESNLSSDLFKKLDANSDGVLASDELVTGLENDRRSEMASRILASDDTNGDSLLSVDETGLAATDFTTLDTNGDGKVSLDELQAAMKARDAERSKETSVMATMAQEGQQAAASTTKYDSLRALLQAIGQNQASNAYSDQNWLSQMLQTSSTQLSV